MRLGIRYAPQLLASVGGNNTRNRQVRTASSGSNRAGAWDSDARCVDYCRCRGAAVEADAGVAFRLWESTRG